MDVGTGTSATSRRCWMRKPAEPAAKALGKYKRTESALKSGGIRFERTLQVTDEQEELGEDSWDV